jgi:hypothetical protein
MICQKHPAAAGVVRCLTTCVCASTLETLCCLSQATSSTNLHETSQLPNENSANGEACWRPALNDLSIARAADPFSDHHASPLSQIYPNHLEP